MAWFRKAKTPKQVHGLPARSPVPEGLWVRCEECREVLFARELERSLRVCPKCGHHFRLDAPERIRLLLDEAGARELFGSIRPTDPLRFRDTRPYADRLHAYREAVGVPDAVRVLEGSLAGIPVVLAVMDYRFMGGSMGSVVGEKITRAAEHAGEKHRPLIVVSASGGARMQEGILSLMQMAKIASALAWLRERRVPYLSVLTDPTTGGVTASFAMLGDLNIAEPGALIGFAGPRVIEQTIRQSLPEGFQRSEFLLEHGFLDLVVPRHELKETLARCLRLLTAA
ncbi:MAG TPA: acetyl-CoA carboxylase, carboxyltransferase subunit beta [Thermoanaerobaculia bacterium]|nr:acetyl-CoA carboxylase, carboxyltransferase subunit beta [Thermoanaerobaculia bacterium]